VWPKAKQVVTTHAGVTATQTPLVHVWLAEHWLTQALPAALQTLQADTALGTQTCTVVAAQTPLVHVWLAEHWLTQALPAALQTLQADTALGTQICAVPATQAPAEHVWVAGHTMIPDHSKHPS